MLYIYRRTSCDGSFLEKAELLLSRERYEKLKRYRFDKDKELCCIAFLLLRYGLYCEYGVVRIPEISEGQFGKPYLKTGEAYFNLSHCDNSILCSLSQYETGCDIQDYKNSISEIADRVLTGNEIHLSSGNVREISRFWSLKEAYGKYYGFGLGYNYAEKDFSHIYSSDEVQDFEEVKVYSKCFDEFALSCFTNDTPCIQNISYDELSAFIETIVALNVRS